MDLRLAWHRRGDRHSAGEGLALDLRLAWALPGLAFPAIYEEASPMSSAVVFSLTQAQLEALRLIWQERQREIQWRTLDCLVQKHLATGERPAQAQLTDLGRALLAALG